MKSKFTYLFLLLSTLTIVSCSNSSSETGLVDDGSSIPTTFFPTHTGNYWKYHVASANTSTTVDSLYISNDTIISNKTYKKMKTLNAATGFYSTLVQKNGLRIDGSSLKMSGTFSIPTFVGAPQDISLSDFTVFKQNSSQGDLLSSVSGSFDQTIQTYPLTFAYTLKTVADGDLASYSANDNGVITTYNNIKKSKTILTLKITTLQTITVGGVPTPVTVTVMNTQDVITSNSYYCENKGVVYTNTVMNYQFADLSQFNVTLPFPPAGTQTQEEFLFGSVTNP
ncbi:hypothetical protein OX284_004695 [Flavobacterium sp. SUN046]|uniref:hypothetical protein n=1 Tax=Flavobacterium sp. SUN046 TaxID=3002440 RepID=UPI002DC01FE0|nr:hypothetical protein [Flavobacterium sp. SUN046]MEC4048719.1 hypothetical protein [Flavobacterium sp. SUN046]